MELNDLILGSINKSNSKSFKNLGNLNQTTLVGAIGAFFEQHRGPLLVICSDSFDAQNLKQSLFAILPEIEIVYFQDSETLPYDNLSPHQDIISNRIDILSRISSFKKQVVITNVAALMQRLSPTEYIKQHSFNLKIGDTRDITKMKKELTNQGYLLVNEVLSVGEFAVRGSILDIYPMGSKNAYRIDFFDDEVESISIIDIDSQLSKNKIEKINLLPAHEFPLDENATSARLIVVTPRLNLP